MISDRFGHDAPRGSGGVRVWVSVADDGPGIAPVHLPRLTERFYRVNVASSREKGGTGLGLAIVHRLVAAAGGAAELGDTNGGGLTVGLDLPAAPRDRAARRPGALLVADRDLWQL